MWDYYIPTCQLKLRLKPTNTVHTLASERKCDRDKYITSFEDQSSHIQIWKSSLCREALWDSASEFGDGDMREERRVSVRQKGGTCAGSFARANVRCPRPKKLNERYMMARQVKEKDGLRRGTERELKGKLPGSAWPIGRVR